MGLMRVIDECGVTHGRVKQYVKSVVESGDRTKIKSVRETLQTIAFRTTSAMERFGYADSDAAADLLNKYKL